MTGTRATLLREGVAALQAAGWPDPARDARALLAHALRLPPDRLSLDMAAGCGADQAALFRALIARRLQGEPVSHLTGRRAFWRHDFAVSRDVLDPRPETETLVDLALRAPFATVLDLGTGSGAILLSLLAERPAARGLGTDLSDAALAVARINRAALGLEGRADLRRADWFDGITGLFDLVVSNPPYIAAAEMPGLDPSVRDWEPHLALTPGGDGLDAYRAIAAGIAAHLAPGGRVLLEIGPTQAAAVMRLLAASGLRDLAVHADLDGRDRVIQGHAA